MGLAIVPAKGLPQTTIPGAGSSVSGPFPVTVVGLPSNAQMADISVTFASVEAGWITVWDGSGHFVVVYAQPSPGKSACGSVLAPCTAGTANQLQASVSGVSGNWTLTVTLLGYCVPTT